MMLLAYFITIDTARPESAWLRTINHVSPWYPWKNPFSKTASYSYVKIAMRLKKIPKMYRSAEEEGSGVEGGGSAPRQTPAGRAAHRSSAR